MRTWLRGGALTAAIVGCTFDEGGLGSGSTALAGTSGSESSEGHATYAGGTEAPTSSSAGDDAADPDSTSTTTTTGAAEETTAPAPCPELQWWDGEWTRRRTLAIGGLGLVDALDDGIVMVRLDAERIDYAMTRPGGADLRFVQSDGMELAYDVERWNPDGSSWLWVRLVQVPAEADAPLSVAMYYGNPRAPKGADAATTWAAGFVSVHHMEGHEDASGNGHAAASTAEPTAGEGFVAGAQLFDGVDDHLVVTGEDAFDFSTELTIEAIVRVDVFDKEWQAIVTKGDHAWRLQRQSFSGYAGFGTDTAGTPSSLSGTTALDDGQWHYVAATWNGTRKRIYVDGNQDADEGWAGPLQTTDEDVMFGENSGHTGRQFTGRIDEVRISAIARPPGWFVWHAHALADEVIAWGPEESCE